MKQNIKEKMGELLELPQDALRDIPKITIYGREFVLIENHRGIRIYNEKELTISTIIGFIIIKGDKLSISRFDEANIAVEGDISSIFLKTEEEYG